MNGSKLLLVLASSLVVFAGAVAMPLHDGIEEIMEKGFKKGGLRHQISTEVDKDKPNWVEVEKKSAELKKLCDALCKEKQPQGDADSWKKLTEALSKQSKTLSDAAGRRDHANAKATIAKINNSCKECHDLHRP